MACANAEVIEIITSVAIQLHSFEMVLYMTNSRTKQFDREKIPSCCLRCSLRCEQPINLCCAASSHQSRSAGQRSWSRSSKPNCADSAERVWLSAR